MALDHDSGHMEGPILKGQFAGRTLSSLSDEDLLVLLEELRGSDEQGATLIEAYHRPAAARLARGARRCRQRPGPAASAARRGRMTREEAYEVLGLANGAGEDEIRAAHRKLMMKLHPDQGGSTYLAARINEAKDVLLGREIEAAGGKTSMRGFDGERGR